MEAGNRTSPAMQYLQHAVVKFFGIEVMAWRPKDRVGTSTCSATVCSRNAASLNSSIRHNSTGKNGKSQEYVENENRASMARVIDRKLGFVQNTWSLDKHGNVKCIVNSGSQCMSYPQAHPSCSAERAGGEHWRDIPMNTLMLPT